MHITVGMVPRKLVSYTRGVDLERLLCVWPGHVIDRTGASGQPGGSITSTTRQVHCNRRQLRQRNSSKSSNSLCKMFARQFFRPAAVVRSVSSSWSCSRVQFANANGAIAFSKSGAMHPKLPSQGAQISLL
jgi:hypothetical protein